MSTATEFGQVVSELRAAEKLLLLSHENPDGDALGSLLATYRILRGLGKDVLMLMAEDSFPLPLEYQHMPFGEALRSPPEDVAERTVVFLDCGNIDRIRADFAREERAHILNIDHHHDNTRFGTVNLVVPEASCTAEIVFNLAKELGVEIPRCVAEALYVGLVTDTGRFSYENTSASAHRMSGELIDAGVDVHAIYRRLYENLPYSRLQLLSRALARTERHDAGALTLTHLTRRDYEETGALEGDSEGIVDHLRAVEGTAVAALVRELLADDRPGVRKVSLRSVDGRVDVSSIARGLGGGGHRQAAGLSTELPLDALVDRLRAEVRGQLSRDGGAS